MRPGCGTRDAGLVNSVSQNWAQFTGTFWMGTSMSTRSATARRRSLPAGRSAPRPAITSGARRSYKHTVVDALTENTVWWDGNRKMTQAQFVLLYNDFLAHAKGQALFAQDFYDGADPKYRIKTRIYTELSWHSLFIHQLLIRPERSSLASFVPELTIIDMPSFRPDAKRHGGREGSDTMVAINFTRKIVLICGSSYAGEIKKAVFTTLNFTCRRKV